MRVVAATIGLMIGLVGCGGDDDAADDPGAAAADGGDAASSDGDGDGRAGRDDEGLEEQIDDIDEGDQLVPLDYL